MIVRGIDNVGDWTFGKGKNNYKAGIHAVTQMVGTNVSSFQNDCFFAKSDGIDWFTLLGGKDLTALNLAVAARILSSPGVKGIISSNFSLDRVTRYLSSSYVVQSAYGVVTSSQIQSQNLNALLTESGSSLTTEDGSQIIV